MAKNMSLDDLINNLKNVRDNLIELNLEQIQYIYSRILFEMAKHTVYDTTQMRAGIVKAFADKFNISPGIIQATPLNFWEENGYEENADRGWDSAQTNLSEDKTKKKYRVKIRTQDEALYLYETGNFKISSKPPRDNSEFVTMPIQLVSDLVNYGFYEDIDGLTEALDRLIDGIIIQMIGR